MTGSEGKTYIVNQVVDKLIEEQTEKIAVLEIQYSIYANSKDFFVDVRDQLRRVSEVDRKRIRALDYEEL